MMQIMLKKYRKPSYLAALLILDIVFFGSINPRNAYALVVVLGFVLVVLTLYVVVDLLFVLVDRVISLRPMTRHRLHTSITMLGALLLAMQSIGQLTIKDMSAIVPLVLVAAFYLSYQRKQLR